MRDAKFFSLTHTEEVYKEALEHENEENGSVWDCTLIKSMKENNDTIINPIYDWSDADVWEYIKENDYPYNPQYDLGYTRCGCIGCPLATYRIKMKEFRDFPAYKDRYIKAFDRMVEARKAAGKENRGHWSNGQEVFEWWVEQWKHEVKGQIKFDFGGNDEE